jgi:ASPIC/UnbV protein
MKLVGVRTNRAAIGARLEVHVAGAGGADRMISRVVSSGGSFGASPLTVHVGLGDATSVSKVSIYWPVSQVTQVLEHPAIDKTLVVTEPVEPNQSTKTSAAARR